MSGNNGSVNVTQFIVRLCYVLLALVVFGLLFITTGTLRLKGESFMLIEDSYVRLLTFPFYAVVPAGYLALICIDKLLINVKKNLVFENSTLKYLNIISYACVYAACVGVISSIISLKSLESRLLILFFVLAMGEFFMALILQVIKQVFKKAIELKNENDLTI